MSKRQRGTVRPGQRRPIERRAAGASASSAASPGAVTPASAPLGSVPPRPSGLTEAEAARAAEIEATLLAEERAAETERRKKQERGRVAREAVPTAGSLAVRATQEYAYVARDVRRITWLSVGLLAVLIALWVLIDLMELVSF
jgi:hypothetical protein